MHFKQYGKGNVVEENDAVKFNDMSRHVKGYQVSFLGLKWPRGSVDHLSSFSAEVE